MPFIIPANSASASGGFNVDNSLIFNDGSSDSLSRTPSSSSAAGRKKFTISAWVKRANLTAEMGIFSGGPDSNVNGFYTLMFDDADKLRVQYYEGAFYNIMPNMLFRDTSAWYHIVISNDTTNNTSADRTKIYVNGVQQAVTSASGGTAPQPNINFDYNVNNDSLQQVGARRNSGGSPAGYFDGYIAEFCMIDNQYLAADSFGEFDEDSGIWKPIDVSGLTFGTNGFYLEYKASGTGTNASGMGADTSGNTNHFAVNNLTSTDQSTDTCTNNFATANPLANLVGSPTYSEGNLEVTGNSSANHNWQSTIGVSSGKWYWEMKSLASSPDTGLLFYDQSIAPVNSPGAGFGTLQRQKIVNSAATGSAIGSTAQNDIHGMALDLDNGKMFIHRNGTYLESGDPANGTNPFIETSDGLATEGVFGGFSYDGTVQINFGGCPAFAISSGNADGDGFGNFEYAPPSGFFALCTKNLAEYG